MNPTMRIIYAVLDFLILNIISIVIHKDVYVWLWYFLAISLAFLLRVGIELNNRTLTSRSIMIQTIYTVSYCFFAIIFWKTYLNYNKGFEVYLFINSLFAVFIVGQLESMFKAGFRTWARNWLKSVIASEDKGESES